MARTKGRPTLRDIAARVLKRRAARSLVRERAVAPEEQLRIKIKGQRWGEDVDEIEDLLVMTSKGTLQSPESFFEYAQQLFAELCALKSALDVEYPDGFDDELDEDDRRRFKNEGYFQETLPLVLEDLEVPWPLEMLMRDMSVSFVYDLLQMRGAVERDASGRFRTILRHPKIRGLGPVHLCLQALLKPRAVLRHAGDLEMMLDRLDVAVDSVEGLDFCTVWCRDETELPCWGSYNDLSVGSRAGGNFNDDNEQSISWKVGRQSEYSDSSSENEEDDDDLYMDFVDSE